MARLGMLKKPLEWLPDEYTWARAVSDVLSPPVVWMLFVIPVALTYASTTREAVLWSFIYSFFVCLLPLGFIFFMYWMGKIGDIHMKERHERYKPMLLTIGSTVVGFGVLKHLNAPVPLQVLAIISLLQISIMTVVTMYWQISMHAMAITGATMATATIFSVSLAMLTVPLIVLVGAARLRLERHTPAQIFAGAMVGLLVPVILFLGFGSVLASLLF